MVETQSPASSYDLAMTRHSSSCSPVTKRDEDGMPLTAFAWRWSSSQCSRNKRSPTCKRVVSIRVRQDCQKLTILMCVKRFLTSPGCAHATSATLGRFLRKHIQEYWKLCETAS